MPSPTRNQAHSFISGFHLILPLPQSMSKLPACQVALPSRVLSPLGLCFKTPHFRNPQGFLQDSLGKGLSEQWLGAGLPQKRFLPLCSSRSLEFMANHNTKLAPGFAALWRLFLISVNVATLWGLLGPGKALGRPYGLYQMLSNQGNCFSPCDPSDYASCSWGFTLLLHQCTARH